MNWDAVGAIAEVIGTLTVVASVIYLGAQVRQTNKLGQASAQREVNAAFNTIVYNWNANAELVRRAFLDFESLSKTDQLIASNCLAPFANHLDQVIRMHEQGYESRESVDVYGDICMAFVLSPGGKTWWENIRPYIPKASFDYIENRLAEPADKLPKPITETVLWFQAERENETAT
jgi:hypothetical protein